MAGKQKKDQINMSKEALDFMKQGEKAEKDGDLGMALWNYWQAADIDNKHPDPYMALAVLHLKRKEEESALKAYQKAILNGGKRNPEIEKAMNRSK